jgi:methylthioribose-1-phosphate isomerase
MLVDGRYYRSIWLDEGSGLPRIIDQTRLPFEFKIQSLSSVDDAVEAIVTMRVRGAPLIGATAAHGLALALAADPSDSGLRRARARLESTRPTAVNLRWALDRVQGVVESSTLGERAARALSEALKICEEDVETCSAIGGHGMKLIQALASTRSGRPVQILTHCNAGWLATVDWGTALAPIYKAHDAGIPVHVWVDETRPRNQGASLTAFELREHGVPHTVIVDNAGGHLMQRGKVDAVIVGSDRTTASGDVCNKIGTYLKALAARANGIPFYVALPVSSIDWAITDGLYEIEIEERSGDEIRLVSGKTSDGRVTQIELLGVGSDVSNPAFDVTPARYVSGLITEFGVFQATTESLRELQDRLPVEIEAKR